MMKITVVMDPYSGKRTYKIIGTISQSNYYASATATVAASEETKHGAVAEVVAQVDNLIVLLTEAKKDLEKL